MIKANRDEIVTGNSSVTSQEFQCGSRLQISREPQVIRVVFVVMSGMVGATRVHKRCGVEP
jgi:hypothetical protein